MFIDASLQVFPSKMPNLCSSLIVKLLVWV